MTSDIELRRKTRIAFRRVLTRVRDGAVPDEWVLDRFLDALIAEAQSWPVERPRDERATAMLHSHFDTDHEAEPVHAAAAVVECYDPEEETIGEDLARYAMSELGLSITAIDDTH